MMRSNRHDRTLTALGILLALLAVPPATARCEETMSAPGATTGPLTATLEALGYFVYEGDPLRVRVTITNTSDKPYDNTAPINLLSGLKVSSSTGAKIAQ